MADTPNQFDRRTFLCGAGGVVAAGTLAGCNGGGGSNGDNGTGTGTETEAGTETGTEPETPTETEAGTATSTETETGTATETTAETGTTVGSGTETGTEAGAGTETGNETGTGAGNESTPVGTETTAGTPDTGNGSTTEARRDREARLTFGEIRQEPPSELESLDQEYVELINASGSVIDLSGYTIEYGDGASYTFDDGFELGVGETVTIHTGSGDDTDTDVYVGRDEVALNYQGPDDVTVTNAAGTVVLEATV